MIDCLIIGYYEQDFQYFVNRVMLAGGDTPARRDLNLNSLSYDGRPQRCLDLFNRIADDGFSPGTPPRFHSYDFLMPVVACLGSHLAKRGYTFDYINLFHREKARLRDLLCSGDILTIAITTTFYVTPEPVREIVAFIREHNSLATIIVGGPHILYYTKYAGPPGQQQLFKYIGADVYVISSEGESALASTVGAFKRGGTLDNIANLAYRRGDEFVFTESITENNSLSDNMIDYGLFPRRDIGQFVSLRTSKSCPFSCSFCDFPQIAGKYTYLRPDEVQRELDAIRDLESVTTLTFIDDTFNVPQKRFKELLRMMIRNDYEFKWNCFFRADHADEETIALMRDAGCEGVFMGIESASDVVLKNMNKTATQRDYAIAIARLKQAGILAYASLIVGFPGETIDTLRETIDFINSEQPDFFLANAWYGHPSTPIFRRSEEFQLRGAAYNWSHATMDARTSGKLLEHVFLNVTGSTWLPCDLWSVFYLQRMGITLRQFRSFVQCFNSLVVSKLLRNHQEIDGADIESLRSALFCPQELHPVPGRRVTC